MTFVPFKDEVVEISAPSCRPDALNLHTSTPMYFLEKNKTDNTALRGLLYLTRIFHYLLARACMLKSSCYLNTADCNVYTEPSCLTQLSPFRKTPIDGYDRVLKFHVTTVLIGVWDRRIDKMHVEKRRCPLLQAEC